MILSLNPLQSLFSITVCCLMLSSEKPTAFSVYRLFSFIQTNLPYCCLNPLLNSSIFIHSLHFCILYQPSRLKYFLLLLPTRSCSVLFIISHRPWFIYFPVLEGLSLQWSTVGVPHLLGEDCFGCCEETKALESRPCFRGKCKSSTPPEKLICMALAFKFNIVFYSITLL